MQHPEKAAPFVAVRDRALRYLESEMYNHLDRPYILAIITYALHVCNSPLKDEAFKLFNQAATENSKSLNI